VTRRPATFERPSNPGRGATTGPWWRFLAEASESLDASLEYQETLTNVLRLAVPKIADYAIITVRANDGSLHWAGARHRDPKKASLVDRLQAYVPPDAAHRHPSVDAVQSGKTQVVDIVDENYLRSVARDETHLELLRQLEPTSYVVIPLEARGRVLGSLLFATARESGRAYRDRDVALAKETGKRISRGCTCQCFRSATNDHTVFDLTLGSEPSGSITRWWSPVTRFRLAELRALRGMTQSELAHRSGVTFPTINRMCTNRAKGASLRVLDKIAVVLGVPPGDLIDGTGKARRGKRRKALGN
jgi:DNA-binding Xre family transcriptional regulator